MKKSIILALLFLFILSAQSDAQERRRSYVIVKGNITDHQNKPIRNARIFVDMVKTGVKANKKGAYKVKLAPKNKLITVYHPNYGFINWEYNGEKKIDFLYPKATDALSQKEMEKLGFDFDELKYKNNYGAFNTVTDILTSKFSNVRVDNNGSLTIGRLGPNTVTGDPRPFVLVNDIPTDADQIDSLSPQDIKSIRVLSKPDQTGPYGLRGANGVIIIELKTGEKDSE